MWVTERRIAMLGMIVFSLGCSTIQSWTGSDSRSSRRTESIAQSSSPRLLQTATLVTPNGEVEEIISLDPSVIDEKTTIPNIRFSNSHWLCNTDTNNEAIALRQNEIDLELSFMIRTLNSQKFKEDSHGDFKRILSENMRTNLYNTPDCKPYRFKLKIVKQLLKGHHLDGIEDSIIR